MASIILDKYSNAFFNKIDNRKSRKILKKEDYQFANKFINDFNSPHIPKDRRYERFKIRLRLAKKHMEENEEEEEEEEKIKMRTIVALVNDELVFTYEKEKNDQC